jgi:hypothetical protein
MSEPRRPTPAYPNVPGAAEPEEQQKLGWAAVIYLTIAACLVLLVTFAALQSRVMPSRGDAAALSSP